MGHLILSEDSIRKNRILLSNYRKIIAYVRQYNSALNPVTEKIIQLVKKERSTVKMVIERQNESEQSLAISLMYLIYSGAIQSNIDIHAINRSTEVWIDET
ncbi:MAG: hypothetical protein K0R59_4570 [Sphingobacterium sp.]|jgi:hypothetical protein|nr:hypothetical protein [Sphingobacterium sp.]MDF2904053.1 hypothetical protein [Bacillus sp. (in: firmicutes)]